MTNFKVGDKVRQYIEKVDSEIEELRSRVSLLEHKVAELEGKVTETVIDFDVLEDVLSTSLAQPNELRKQIIEKAKKFVEDVEREVTPHRCVDKKEKRKPVGNSLYRAWYTKFNFHVNKEKRTVTALVHYYYGEGRKPIEVAIAKCAPGDVFNEHIGKAIALGRAYGLDVSDFEQAVQPDEYVAGQVVKLGVREVKIYAVRPTHRTVGDDAGFEYMGEGFTYIDSYGSEVWRTLRDITSIVDDTNAQY